MHEIMLHWSGTLSLPIMPTGAIPLHRDLVRTPNGYIVNPSDAYKYRLTAPKTGRIDLSASDRRVDGRRLRPPAVLAGPTPVIGDPEMAVRYSTVGASG